MNIVSILDNETGIIYYIKSFTTNTTNKTAKITSYATTEGTAISDHAYREPISWEINLELSRFTSADNFYYIDDNAQVSLSCDKAKLLINKWFKNFTRLTINTRENTDSLRFTNMAISSISESENNSNKGIWSPRISFQEVRVATLLTKPITFPKTISDAVNNQEPSDASNDQGTHITAGGFFGSLVAGATTGGIVGKVFGLKGAVVGAVVGAAISFSSYIKKSTKKSGN